MRNQRVMLQGARAAPFTLLLLCVVNCGQKHRQPTHTAGFASYRTLDEHGVPFYFEVPGRFYVQSSRRPVAGSVKFGSPAGEVLDVAVGTQLTPGLKRMFRELWDRVPTGQRVTQSDGSHFAFEGDSNSKRMSWLLDWERGESEFTAGYVSTTANPEISRELIEIGQSVNCAL